MDVGYSIGTLHEGFHEMATIPDNVPEIPEVPGFQESAYKGLESMSEPGKLREWYVGRSDRDKAPIQWDTLQDLIPLLSWPTNTWRTPSGA